MADYPGSIKSFTDQTAQVSEINAADVNVAYDEIEAIEAELGIYAKDTRSASYIIFKTGSTYYAKACFSGGTNYSGTVAATVINNAIAAVSGGRIIIKGPDTFPCNAQISMDGKNNFELIGAGYPILDFATSPASTFSIYFQTTGNNKCLLAGLHIKNSTKTAIIGKGNQLTIRDNIIEDSNLQGINMAGEDIGIYNNKIINVTTEFGIVAGGNTKDVVISGNQIEGCALDAGIEWGYSGSRFIVTANTIYNCKKGILLTVYNYGGYDGGDTVSVSMNVLNDIQGDGISIKRKVADASVVRDFNVVGNTLVNIDSAAFFMLDTTSVSIKDNVVRDAYYGVNTAATNPNTRLKIQNNEFYDTRQQCIILSHDGIDVLGNTIDTVTTYDGVVFPSGNTFSDCPIRGNTFRGTFGRDKIRNLSSQNNSNVKRNHGYLTENSGTGSIANGATTAVITHGLAYTPVAADITITPTEQPTNNPGAIWISTITSTQFTVNSLNPGASNLDFSWAVRKV